ncbi:uracil-DNA glycosylase [Legionella maioricensis]|uniref:Uracil-DNA glycosylase n=1 Tax=Legionella maioricensis TaxID=2896528 RepID=A0A9X2ICD7_9GAMM|nr:uracil-DNA glycosylase [Legionella maioricensis]MCL9685131.1 uracil-DNA glycosylase [Legionella maioricensis]MCL9688356.1 uracil-DNA glycosylase [Legionella maioricensis]
MPDSVTTWADILGDEKSQPYFTSILQFLAEEKNAGKIIYPAQNELFNAFKETPYEQVKVVILGQDPYHGPGQAHGLSFSVKPGVKPPPSLKNIFQELKNDLNVSIPMHGCLKKWANQGVLLLNTSLSVEQNKPQSHSKIGWTTFTDNVIRKLNHHSQPLVFLLWGAHAKNKNVLISENKHLVLTAAHPSPFSVHQGFFGCRHFSKTNDFLKANGRTPIDWNL